MKDTNIIKQVMAGNFDRFTIEERAAGEEGGRELVLEGYAATYDTPSVMYAGSPKEYTETIAAGAFDGADLDDVALKYNHSEHVPILARTRNKSLELTTDEKGLHVRAVLLDTTDAVDMYKRVKAGLLDKMSFAFLCRAADVVDEIKDGKKYRTYKKMQRILDVSVVDFPAYQSTDIQARAWGELENLTAPELENENAPATTEKRAAVLDSETRKIMLLHRRTY